MSGPYWLEDPLEASGSAARRAGDVAVVGGASRAARARACSPRPGSACGEARRVGRRQRRATVGSAHEEGRPCRRRSPSAAARRRPLALDRLALRPDGECWQAIRSGAPAASGSRPTRRRRAAAPRVRADARGRVRGRVARRKAPRALFAMRMFHPSDSALQPARWTRRLPRWRRKPAPTSVRRAASVNRRTRRRGRRRTDGSGRRRARSGLIIPHGARCSRPGRSGAALRLPALQPPRVRLLAAARGRPHPRRRLPRHRARRRVHDEGTTAAIGSLEPLVADLKGWPVVPTHQWAGCSASSAHLPAVISRARSRADLGCRRLLGARDGARVHVRRARRERHPRPRRPRPRPLRPRPAALTAPPS